MLRVVRAQSADGKAQVSEVPEAPLPGEGAQRVCRLGDEQAFTEGRRFGGQGEVPRVSDVCAGGAREGASGREAGEQGSPNDTRGDQATL